MIADFPPQLETEFKERTKEMKSKVEADRKKKPVVSNKGSMLLKCELTSDELLACGARMANASATLKVVEGEFETVKSQYKAKVSEQEAVIQKNAGLINTKFEHRMVEVDTVSDYNQETVTVIRQDTHEVVETRRMTADELSRLPLGEEQNGGVE